MKDNKKNTSLIISIVVVVGIIAGGFYFYNYSPKGDSAGETTTVDSKILATTPKEIFLERNTELYNAKSFDEMIAVARKYDSAQRIIDNESIFKEANDEKKKAFFGFAQGLMIPTSSFTKVEEKIEGDSAVVTAFDNRGHKSTATFIKEGGDWKISDLKILQSTKE